MIAGIDHLPEFAVARAKRLEADLATWRASGIDIAQGLVWLRQNGFLPDLTFSTLAGWGARVGLSPAESAHLAEVGRAIVKRPRVADDVRRGDLSLDSAAQLGRIAKDKAFYAEPPHRSPGTPQSTEGAQAPVAPASAPVSPLGSFDSWHDTALTVTPKELKNLVDRRIEEVRGGHAPVVTMTLHVPEKTRKLFSLAREIASKKAGTVLTEGQTLQAVVDHYLDKFDPGRVRPGQRRVGSTEARGGGRSAGRGVVEGGSAAPGRYVPAQVQREVRARSEGKCAHPGCPNRIFLELAHKVPHRDGGSRESDNLYGLCTRHHRAYDRGEFTIVGPMEAPTFIDAKGRRIAPNGRVIEQRASESRIPAQSEAAKPGNERAPP